MPIRRIEHPHRTFAPDARSGARRLLAAALAVAAVLLAAVLMVAWPFVYNYHLAPMARLAKRVHVGSDCGQTARAFGAYADRRLRAENEEMQYADAWTADDAAYGHLVPSRRLLHLYDVTIFDDVQLTAICDPAGRRVEQVRYIAD